MVAVMAQCRRRPQTFWLMTAQQPMYRPPDLVEGSEWKFQLDADTGVALLVVQLCYSISV